MANYYATTRTNYFRVKDSEALKTLMNEKLSYVTAIATIITSTSCETIELTDFAYEKASQMLGNPKWTTMYNY